MKRKVAILAILIAAIMVLAVVTPTVMAYDCDYFIRTDPATDITATSATLNGYRDSGAYNCDNYVWFEWGTTTSYGNETAKQEVSLDANFSETITGLTPGTTYHYRAVIDLCGHFTSDGICYGDDMTFTTKEASAPIPEFTTIAVPVAGILGLFLFFNYRNRKKE